MTQKHTVEYEELECAGELQSAPRSPAEVRTGTHIMPMPDCTDAHLMVKETPEIAAIHETACGSGSSQCAMFNDCPIKAKLDDFIFRQLDENYVPAIEIRFCGHYTPKNYWSGK